MAQPFTPQIVVPALFSSANLADFPRVTGSVPAAAIAVLDASIWINPPTDPFVIANWRNVITDYQQAGLTVLGYVPTDNGASANSQPTRDGSPKDPARAVADIAAYVDRWYTIFAPAQPNGIFFDEGPYPSRFTGCTPATETTPATLCGDVKDYYAAIYAHVKSKPPGPNTVMLNAAGYTEADNWVMTRPGADIAQLQETPATKYLVTGAGGFPASPPAWWTDPQYAPERIAHVVWGCVTVADMCRVVALAEQRKAGYVYAFDGTSNAYDKLPGYWRDELVTVALRDDNDVYVRDWTDSPSAFDQGLEPSTKAWWVTSDIWNRLDPSQPAGGFFDANDRPLSEDPQFSPSGAATNYAFARIHRKPCGAALSVNATFLWADFGTGTNFQLVSNTPQTAETFAPGEFAKITSAVPWQLPAVGSGHVCLAVELTTAPAQLDPLKGGTLNGTSSSTAEQHIPVDNNKAQRNVSVVTVLPLRESDDPLCAYAIVHNPETDTQDRTIRAVVSDDLQENLGETALQIITADGAREPERVALGEDVILEAMRPGENRWVEILFTTRPSRVRERVPITFEEIVDGQAVNGFTLAVQLAGLEEVIRTNARSLAWQLRRIGGLFQRASTREDGRRALRFANAADPSPVDYVELIGAQRWLKAERVPQLTPPGDPLGLEPAWTALSEALRSGDPRAIATVHTCFLARLDASLTMLQKARGDAADILQTVRWQVRLHKTNARLADLKATGELLEQSEAFLVSYRLGEAGAADYPAFIADLLEVFRDIAQLAAEAGVDLAPELQRLERPTDPTGTQGGHRDFLLALEEFVTGTGDRPPTRGR